MGPHSGWICACQSCVLGHCDNHCANIATIWSKLMIAQCFPILEIISGYHHISIHPDSRPQTAFTCPYKKFQWKRAAFGVQTAPSVFLYLMFKLFFKYSDDFLAFWKHDLLTHSQTEEDHLKHIYLVFEKFHEAGIKLKMSKCKFFKSEIDYLVHLVSRKGISPMKQEMKAITDLAPTTNITEARHMIGLIG